LDDVALAMIPSALRPVVKNALQPDPAKRFQSAHDMERALTNALGTEGMVQGRHALAAVVQRLFPDERKFEADTSYQAEEAPPTMAASPFEQVNAVEVTSTSETSKVPSGLTLAPPVVHPVARPDFIRRPTQSGLHRVRPDTDRSATIQIPEGAPYPAP